MFHCVYVCVRQRTGENGVWEKGLEIKREGDGKKKEKEWKRQNERWDQGVRIEAVKLSSPHSRGPWPTALQLHSHLGQTEGGREGGRPQPLTALKQDLRGDILQLKWKMFKVSCQQFLLLVVYNRLFCKKQQSSGKTFSLLCNIQLSSSTVPVWLLCEKTSTNMANVPQLFVTTDLCITLCFSKADRTVILMFVCTDVVR